MHLGELVLVNVIFLVSSILIVLFIGNANEGGPGQRKLWKMLFVGFVIFHLSRWLPFAILMGNRVLNR